MNKLSRIFTFAAFALCFSISTFAQTASTGTIEGTVVDTQGAVVPGATVTVSGDNLIRPQTVTSDSDGNFRVSQVPPGSYTITVAAISGFSEYKRDNISVNLSKTTTLNVELGASTGAVVDVTGGAGAEIDTTNNTTGTNVSSEQFSNFPTARTVQSLYTIAPTVTRSGLRDAAGRDRDPSVAGSSGPENNYILDGVNTTDPAFGGGGANLPFEFVQEVEVKTGAYGAEYGLATGGIFNVITKQGTNEFHGEVYGYLTSKSFVRETKNFPFTGLAPDGFSELDGGAGIGGPIIKNRLTFYANFNPQRRKNNSLTQSLRQEVENKITTPFYAGKLTWNISDNNVFNASTFADFTKEEGHLFAGSGFGANLDSFRGVRETGGTNYAFRLNSTFNQNFIAEFSLGLHFQRNNVIPEASVGSTALNTDAFAILRANGTVAPVTQTGVNANAGQICNVMTNVFTGPNSCRTGNVDYVFAPGGSLQRNYVRDGFGLFQDQTRNRYEVAARFQNIWGKNTIKYGFEAYRNKYDIAQTSSGSPITYANPFGLLNETTADANQTAAQRVTNSFFVCTTRSISGVGTVVCPTAAAALVFNTLPLASRPTGFTANAIVAALSQSEFFNNPFLIRSTTRVRDFALNAETRTDVESFYIQDDAKVSDTVQLNLGVRWDLQQAYGNEGEKYLSLNNLFDNLQPRIGVVWDFTGQGKGKVFANYARYVETPIPLDLNVRAGSENSQTDKNFNVNTYGGPTGSTIVPGLRANLRVGTTNLGAEPTPIDPDLKPQTVNEWTAGVEYEVSRDLVLGFRGIYRPQGTVIEDGSFDDGGTYFIFNPGESTTNTIAGLPPCSDPPVAGEVFGENCGGVGQRFGRARRYYRALEFTATRRFNNNFAFITSYVFSSLTGNYEGLFRNDNQQADPNITSLFDLVSLLNNTYGRLPNDRPHQFKFNGTYKTPFKAIISGNFYAQSGTPFNALIPHPVYGNNEGFLNPRGTTIVPNVVTNSGISTANGGIESAIGKNRSPLTYNLDLGLYVPVSLGEKRELRFTADWFNVLNVQRAITLDQTFQITSGASGVPNVPNPFFGSGQIFQYPSSFRLGAKFRF